MAVEKLREIIRHFSSFFSPLSLAVIKNYRLYQVSTDAEPINFLSLGFTLTLVYNLYNSIWILKILQYIVNTRGESCPCWWTWWYAYLSAVNAHYYCCSHILTQTRRLEKRASYINIQICWSQMTGNVSISFLRTSHRQLAMASVVITSMANWLWAK